MFARLVRRSLEGTAKRRGNPRLGLGELDADHLSLLVLSGPIILMLTMHGGANEQPVA